MATQCNNAPFINQNFYITGYWGEPRATHIHAGYDLSTGGINNVYNMYDGYVIDVNPTGAGSGYGPNIIIQCLDGMTWLYGDLSPFSGFSIGDHVLQGQYIATEGNPTGTSSTGYHVHIELEYLQFGQAFLYGYENSSDPRYSIRVTESRRWAIHILWYTDTTNTTNAREKKKKAQISVGNICK